MRPAKLDSYRLLLAVLLGSATAAVFVVLGTLAALLVVVLIAWIEMGRDRAVTLGAALVGAGATVIALGLAANAECGKGCVAPDLLPFNLAALALVAVGAALIVSHARTGSPSS